MIEPGPPGILCGPATPQELRVAAPAFVEKSHRQPIAGTLKNRAGQSMKEALNCGVVRADGKFLYPIRQAIPVMQVD